MPFVKAASTTRAVAGTVRDPHRWSGPTQSRFCGPWRISMLPRRSNKPPTARLHIVAVGGLPGHAICVVSCLSIRWFSLETVLGLTRVPSAWVMSSTRRTETPARYISISASSTDVGPAYAFIRMHVSKTGAEVGSKLP